MKVSAKILLLPCVLAATFAVAQTIPPHTFSHIIIIIQENRTPDNIFGSNPIEPLGCGFEAPFEPGVDILNGGSAKGMGTLCNIALPMNSVDPNHTYKQGWLPQYDSGNMDGFCQIVINGKCQQYSYVQKTDVQPYFDLATSYGFANYFFQTNEGPSFPAHQFLFTGTSAPVAPLHNNYLDFVAGNANFSTNGCPDTSDKAGWVDPTGTPLAGSFDCYTHDSLVTNSSGDKNVSWRYYTPQKGVIWTAPAAIPEVCYGANNLNKQGQPCSGTEWTSHVILPGPGQTQGAPVLTDIASCNLAKISWVIPDEAWSDHPGFDTHSPPLGPSWVGDIVDAVGNSWTNSNHQCDYWGNNSSTPEPTAIFIVWDDWGGWFDHVVPPAVYRSSSSTSCPTSVAPNGWGCGYTYGFRVPFLVVSEYTKAGYVSGPCDLSGCNNKVFPYVHDSGSILAFTEYNFGMQPIAPPYYADYNAPDWDALHSVAPLSDFFSLSNQRNFTNIPTVYPPIFYTGFYFNNPTYPPTGPDGTDSD